MRLVAIDIGSGNSKGRNKHGHTIFPSLAGSCNDTADSAFSLNSHEHNKVSFDKGTFYVGASAKTMLQPDQIKSTLSPDWAGSPAFMALMYKMIAELMPEDKTQENIGICTGVPIDFYKASKERLKNVLCGNHSFKIGQKQYHISIAEENIFILPQAAALYFSDHNEFERTREGRHGYLDFGTYTSGCAMIEDLEFIDWESMGMPVGASDLIKAVQEYIKKQYGVTMRYESVRKVVETGRISIQGNTIDAREQITLLARKVFNQLLNDISDKWKGGKDANVYVGGGMATHLFSLVRETFPHAQLLSSDEHCVYDVVDGYYVYLQSQMKRRNKAA